MRRRLDAELVRRRLADSRTAAARLIREGRVAAAGHPAPKPATMIDAGDAVHITAPGPRYVSRGGLKLEVALREFGVSASGRRAVDVGASTGGFTHCLLAHGAAHVTAVDVGYGQLHFSLRRDRRVSAVERTNIRYADPARLGAPFGLVAADVSFISLRTIAPALAGLGGGGADYLLLIKPQFEAGRGAVDRRGVIQDPEVRVRAVAGAVSGLAEAGLGALALTPSPIEGAKGNKEVFGWFRRGPSAVGPEQVREAAE